MNAEESSLLWNRKDEVDQIGGSAAHRQLALKHLKLKTVIKVAAPLGAYCMPTCMHANLGAKTCGSFGSLLIKSCRELNDTIGASGEPCFSCASVGFQLYKRQHAELVCDSRQGSGTAQLTAFILSDQNELLQSHWCFRQLFMTTCIWATLLLWW